MKEPDGNEKIVLDTVQTDSISEIRKYTWLGAKVVGSTMNTQVNFITIHRGSLQDVRPNMGVMSPQGIVGTVVNVSDNYASVMTLVTPAIQSSGKIKEWRRTRNLEWDGVSPMLCNTEGYSQKRKGERRGFDCYQSDFFSVFRAI